MCEVLDRIEARGIEKGIEQGIEKGMERGIEKGRLEGRQEGIISTLVSLVKDGILNVDEAAIRANMSTEVFEKYIK